MAEKYVKVSDIEEYCSTYGACLNGKGQSVTQAALRRVKEFAAENSVDVQPVRRGYWKNIMMSEATGWDLSLTGGRDEVLETVCSLCGNCCAFDGNGDDYLSPYCPNCGAELINGNP